MSDIHANLTALQKALFLIESEAVAGLAVCGDVVGYGRNPNECCRIVRGLKCPVVAGNHDWAVAGLTEFRTSFSSRAVEGVEFTKSILSAENLDWLRSLPLYHRQGDLEFVHASLLHPGSWHYLALGRAFPGSIFQDAAENFKIMKGSTCFVGHSHRPALYLQHSAGDIEVITAGAQVNNLAKKRAIIDVGSVGEPRSRFQTGSLVIYESEPRQATFKQFLI